MADQSPSTVKRNSISRALNIYSSKTLFLNQAQLHQYSLNFAQPNPKSLQSKQALTKKYRPKASKRRSEHQRAQIRIRIGEVSTHGERLGLGQRKGIPWVVERADLVGVEWDRISFLVAVIGVVGANVDREAGDQSRENQNRRALLHCGSSVFRTKKDENEE